MTQRRTKSTSYYLATRGWEPNGVTSDNGDIFTKNGWATASDRDGDWCIWREGKSMDEPEALVFNRPTGADTARAIERKVKARSR